MDYARLLLTIVRILTKRRSRVENIVLRASKERWRMTERSKRVTERSEDQNVEESLGGKCCNLCQEEAKEAEVQIHC